MWKFTKNASAIFELQEITAKFKELIKAVQNKKHCKKSCPIESESENYYRYEGDEYVVNVKCKRENNEKNEKHQKKTWTFGTYEMLSFCTVNMKVLF